MDSKHNEEPNPQQNSTHTSTQNEKDDLGSTHHHQLDSDNTPHDTEHHAQLLRKQLPSDFVSVDLNPPENFFARLWWLFTRQFFPAYDLPHISWEEIALHNHAKSCWVVVDGVVYDITRVLPHHPGGNVILQFAATDCSEHFHFHSGRAKQWWRKCPRVGRVRSKGGD